MQIGTGPAIVLLHPFPSCHEFWLPVSQTLAQRYSLIIPDLRGMGQLSAGDGEITVQTHADDLAGLCHDLDLGKAVFIGCSIGGYILFEMWRAHREHVRAMVLCNTKASADTPEAASNRLKSIANVEQNGPEPFCDRMAELCMGDSTKRNRPDVYAAARKTMRHSTVEGLVANLRCLGSRPDSISTLASINAPALIISGDEDALSSREDAMAMHRGINGSQHVAIPQTAHYSPYERPDECARVMRQFLDGLPNL